MKIDVAYTCVSQGKSTLFFITRFIATHHQYPAGENHRVVAVFNGGKAPQSCQIPFFGLTHRIFERANEGWDIGGYIDAANGPCRDSDIMVCLGESVHFNRTGWLRRIRECWEQYGEGMYGMLASNLVRPHLQTTAFITSPRLLRGYPKKVVTKDERYDFEHGRNCFLKFVERQHLPVRLVTWDGCWTKDEWRAPSNILWKGDQTNCLVWCNHTENYIKAPPTIRATWERCANGAFR